MRLLSGLWGGLLLAQTQLHLVRLKPKPDSLLPYYESYLSADALKRRQLQGIPISASDLPVPLAWLDTLARYGRIWGVLRWQNAVLMELSGSALPSHLSFVECVEPFTRLREKRSSGLTALRPGTAAQRDAALVNSLQLSQLRLPELHQMGYRGKGIRVAILDAGFPYMDQIPAFQHIFREGRFILGYDFVERDSSVFGDNAHGTLVASAIVAHDPEGMGFYGGAPEVSVILARTEDALSETRIEEWNWARAVEWADSLGAYIIQSSLGYSTFDDPSENYTYMDMNGKTAITTQAARMAAQKGLLVVTSAGNEGSSPWRYITAPADADSVIAVGAVGTAGQIAPFSSRGPTADGRIKPDLVALGWGTYVVGLSGEVQQASGTSFAAPMITSLAACVWQAAPELPGWEVRAALLQAGDRASSPDTLYGFGIPDGEKALRLLLSRRSSFSPPPQPRIYPSPAQDYLSVFLPDPSLSWYDVDIYDAQGRLLLRRPYRGMMEMTLSIETWRSGLYYLTFIPRSKGGPTYHAIFVKV